MSFKNQSVVQVSFMRGKETLALGQLALKDRIIFFEYHPDFIKTGLELSPFKLPLKAGMTACRDQVFDGLFGIFNDSLPDGWGRFDHRIPNLDYENIMQVTLWLTKKIHECEKQFRAAVFNMFACNRDDHAKNFSFLMNKNGVWSVSPAYDLTFSSGPTGEHCTMIMGEGKKPTLSHLLKLAEISGLKKANALQIIDQVKAAVAKWKEYAKEAGVSATSLKMIQKRLLDITSV